MPTDRSTGRMAKLWAMAGSAVAITVPSRNSMKNAPATSSGSVRGWFRKDIGLVVAGPGTVS